jgi:hypothetical protein
MQSNSPDAGSGETHPNPCYKLIQGDYPISCNNVSGYVFDLWWSQIHAMHQRIAEFSCSWNFVEISPSPSTSFNSEAYSVFLHPTLILSQSALHSGPLHNVYST